ncbi:unnamed protein product [Camellia sinensis]
MEYGLHILCSFRCILFVFVFVFSCFRLSYCAIIEQLIKPKAAKSSGCDLFQGSWVYDDTYPLYNLSICPFIEPEFDCQRNGRPDKLYLKYKWKPNGCDLPRFNGEDLLRRIRGKKIMFVGDSLSLNQWQSLTCMIHAAVPNRHFSILRKDDLSTFTLQEYNISVMISRNAFLVDLVREKIGRVLKLDSIENGKSWKGVDMLIFNTWHWWLHKGSRQPKREPLLMQKPTKTRDYIKKGGEEQQASSPQEFGEEPNPRRRETQKKATKTEKHQQTNNRPITDQQKSTHRTAHLADSSSSKTKHHAALGQCHEGWDYIQKGHTIYQDMDRLSAFKEGLTTWSKWVNSNINPSVTKVFFQGISPTHYDGTEWNESNSTTCKGQRQPLSGSLYPGGLPPPVAVVKEVLHSMSSPVTLLDITTLSQLRKDGHPSIYGIGGNKGNDCSHWCLAGVPDTWNLLLT